MSQVQINTPAPDFALPDFNGMDFQLSEWHGKKNLVLVFNRGFV